MQLTEAIYIPDSELVWSFARSSGPGGQNVNKVASKAILRWSLAQNQSLPADVRVRLRQQQGRRLTQQGEVIIASQRYRDQNRNIEDCLGKLRDAIVQAFRVPKVRKRSRPSRGSKERRLQAKHHRQATKQARKAPERD